MFRKVSKRVFAVTFVVSPDALSHIPSNSSAVKTPENTEADPDQSEPADEGDIQMEFSSDWLYRPSIGAVTEITCNNSGQ